MMNVYIMIFVKMVVMVDVRKGKDHLVTSAYIVRVFIVNIFLNMLLFCLVSTLVFYRFWICQNHFYP